MNELFKRDLTIKIISVLLAVLLWFYVSGTTNTLETTNLTVPLKVQNEDTLQKEGIIIKNKNYLQNVVISLKGRKGNIDAVNVNDVEAVVDFSKVKDAATKDMKVEVYISKEGISIEDIKPRTITVDLEKRSKNPFSVEVVPVGNVKESYKIIKMSANPETVQIEGNDTLVKSIASIKAFIDVNNIDRNVTAKKECRLFNKDEEEITALDKKSVVEIKLEIAREVPIIPNIKGMPAKNYIEGQKSIKPEKALITGSPEVLAQIKEIKTEPIDIENASNSVNTAIRLSLPEGVALVDTPQEVAVSVVVEQLAKKDFTITKDDIILKNAEIDNSLKYDITTQSITVAIKGSQIELRQLDLSKLKPSIDVDKLAEGTYRIPLNLELPASVKLAEDYSIEIKIDKR